MADEALTHWADEKIVWIRRWAILYWTIYTWFCALSWVVAIFVPTASAILLYVSDSQRQEWNIAILAAGGVGLILQVLASVLRLKERSFRGQRLSATLEVAVIKYRAGLLETPEFVQAIEYFLKEGYQEEGP